MSAVQGVVNLSGPAGISDQDEFIIIGFTQGFVIRSVGTYAHGQDDQIRGKYGLFAGLRVRDGHFAFFHGCQPHAFPDAAAVLHDLLGQVHDHAGIQISADLVQHLDHGDFIFLISTTVTLFFSARYSAVSRPVTPPPMITIF